MIVVQPNRYRPAPIIRINETVLGRDMSQNDGQGCLCRAGRQRTLRRMLISDTGPIFGDPPTFRLFAKIAVLQGAIPERSKGLSVGRQKNSLLFSA